MRTVDTTLMKRLLDCLCVDKLDIKTDGDSICVTEPDFINLELSHAGFGDTIDEAINDLIDRIYEDVI
jgi:hypothetical protein